MVKGPSMSRPPPKSVGPIEIEGVIYTQLMDVADEDNRTGWLRAVDSASGNELWTMQVYRHEIDPTMERDVQEFYFRSMEPGAGGVIIIENERGERFSVDVVSRKSTRLE